MSVSGAQREIKDKGWAGTLRKHGYVEAKGVDEVTQ